MGKKRETLTETETETVIETGKGGGVVVESVTHIETEIGTEIENATVIGTATDPGLRRESLLLAEKRSTSLVAAKSPTETEKSQTLSHVIAAVLDTRRARGRKKTKRMTSRLEWRSRRSE